MLIWKKNKKHYQRTPKQQAGRSGYQNEVAQVDLDWKHKGELLVALWARESFTHLKRKKT